MKNFCYLLVCGLPLFLQAQIQIELVEPDVVEEAADVAAPDAVDHSVPEVNGPEVDLLHFLNGDRLSGALQEIGAESGLVWKHPDAKAETVYALENVKLIQFKADSANVDDLMSLARIELTNGDQYRGRIIRMDTETLVIESPLTGKVNLRAEMIHAIRPIAGSNAIYSGPNSMEEWEQNNNGNGQWELKNNAMYSNNHNQIAGMMLDDLPDKISFDFSVEWRGNINLQVGFWGRDPKNVNQNCYTLAIQNSYLRCYRNYNKIGRNDLGNAQVREEMKDGKLDVRLLLNREAKEILVLFNGKIVARWNDTFDGVIKGDAIIFGGMANTPVKVSRISVREWDGEFDLDQTEKPNVMDQLITLNGDIFAGKLEKIEADILYFKNDFAVFQVPLDRVSEVSFSRETRAEPRLQAGDVEIFLPNKERMTLQLTGLDHRAFTGSSEATGEISLLKKYFMEMKLNPYDDRHHVEEEGW
ncbi:hypothetical protein P0Y35_09365 [Kiritimatiellaeota bacterium B1221]|nr:hypothetical protein [Kiritimatiellaeota bacterium B1221]